MHRGTAVAGGGGGGQRSIGSEHLNFMYNFRVKYFF
jgi:hypothetical protein